MDATAHEAQFGKFTLLAELSRSPNGIVYRARQNDLGGRIVALKVLVDPDDPLDDRVERFRREVGHVSRLRHPNIVSVFEVGETDGFTWFSMEFVDGMSLAEWLHTHGPLADIDAAKLLIKIARAIHYAHTRGIIHRDIKPGNILLDRDSGDPMIVDFGLARDIATDIRITRSGVTMGTPPYMPPEQARGRHDMLDSRSDVYALGATLYEALTARPPFVGETPVQVMMQVLDRMPPRPRKLRPRISSDLEAIILKCLAKKQRDRYENAERMAQDIERFTRNEWVHARKATMLARMARLLPARRYLIVVLIVLAAISLQWAIVRSNSPNPLPGSRAAVLVAGSPGGQEAGWEVLSGDLHALYNEMELDGQHGETRVLYSRPLTEPDVEFSLTATADLRRDRPGAASGLGLFLVPDRNAALPRSGVAAAVAPVMRGYLLWLGADRNSRSVLCRDGREVTFLQESPRGGRGLRLQPGEYHISLRLTGNTIEAEVSGDRRVWFTRFDDDFPLALPPTRRFGLVALGGNVVISEFRHSTRPRDTIGRAEDAGERLFRGGQYQEAFGEFQQLMRVFGESADEQWRKDMKERRELARTALLMPVVPELLEDAWKNDAEPGDSSTPQLPRAGMRRADVLIATGRAVEAAALIESLVATPTLRSDQRRAMVLHALRQADELELRARTNLIERMDADRNPLPLARAALRILAAIRDQFALDDLAHDDRLVDPMLALRIWCQWCHLQLWVARLAPDDETRRADLADLEQSVLRGGAGNGAIGNSAAIPLVVASRIPLIDLVLSPDGALWFPDAPDAVLEMTHDLSACLSMVDAACDADLKPERFRLLQRVAMEQLGLRRPADMSRVQALAHNALELGLALGKRAAVLELAARQVAVLIDAFRDPMADLLLAASAVSAFADLPPEAWAMLAATASGNDLRRDAQAALHLVADATPGWQPDAVFDLSAWLRNWRRLQQRARDALSLIGGE